MNSKHSWMRVECHFSKRVCLFWTRNKTRVPPHTFLFLCELHWSTSSLKRSGWLKKIYSVYARYSLNVSAAVSCNSVWKAKLVVDLLGADFTLSHSRLRMINGVTCTDEGWNTWWMIQTGRYPEHACQGAIAYHRVFLASVSVYSQVFGLKTVRAKNARIKRKILQQVGIWARHTQLCSSSA